MAATPKLITIETAPTRLTVQALRRARFVCLTAGGVDFQARIEIAQIQVNALRQKSAKKTKSNRK